MLSIASLTSSLNSLALSKPFLHGTSTAPLTRLSKPTSPSALSPRSPSTFLTSIRAMRIMEGRVVCATNNKTVSVQVIKVAPHRKYKRRVRKKVKYQAHDPDNRFQVGDFVRLESIKPISKTKSFLAVPVPPRIRGQKEGSGEVGTSEIGIPLESEQDLQA